MKLAGRNAFNRNTLFKATNEDNRNMGHIRMQPTLVTCIGAAKNDDKPLHGLYCHLLPFHAACCLYES